MPLSINTTKLQSIWSNNSLLHSSLAYLTQWVRTPLVFCQSMSRDRRFQFSYCYGLSRHWNTLSALNSCNTKKFLNLTEKYCLLEHICLYCNVFRFLRIVYVGNCTALRMIVDQCFVVNKIWLQQRNPRACPFYFVNFVIVVEPSTVSKDRIFSPPNQ